MDTRLGFITLNPHVCHGQPCIKRTRILVHLILELMETGLTPEQIIKGYYPQLSKEREKGFDVEDGWGLGKSAFIYKPLEKKLARER